MLNFIRRRDAALPGVETAKMKWCLIALALLAAPATARVPTSIAYQPSMACTPYTGSKTVMNGVQQQRADALIAAFERDYPAALVNPARVEGALLDPVTLARIVDDLACLSTQPGADPFVPEQAAALFASKRYGKAAFALLAKKGQLRFAKQMRAYVVVGR
jgi:hypothetical protein